MWAAQLLLPGSSCVPRGAASASGTWLWLQLLHPSGVTLTCSVPALTLFDSACACPFAVQAASGQ